MPILAASSGMVMPGCPFTSDRASAARVPLPLRLPARRFVGEAAALVALPGGRPAFLRPGGRPAFLRATFGAAVAAAARLRVPEPRGRPDPRRRIMAAPA